MRILVTRPEPGASRTAAALQANGLGVVAVPLFTIVQAATPRPSGRFAALIVTSLNGAAELTPALADLPADLPIFAVGDRTAEAMTANGFSNVTSASGDQKALTRLVFARLKPRYRVLLATGEDHKEALPEAFAAAGHEIALWVRYRAEAVEEMPPAAKEAIASGEITTVLHYSRRAAETFLALAQQAGLGEAASGLRHIALSDDVAEPLRAAGASNVLIAAEPDEDHLLARLGVPADGGEGAHPARAIGTEAGSRDAVSSPRIVTPPSRRRHAVPMPDSGADTTAPAAGFSGPSESSPVASAASEASEVPAQNREALQEPTISEPAIPEPIMPEPAISGSVMSESALSASVPPEPSSTAGPTPWQAANSSEPAPGHQDTDARVAGRKGPGWGAVTLVAAVAGLSGGLASAYAPRFLATYAPGFIGSAYMPRFLGGGSDSALEQSKARPDAPRPAAQGQAAEGQAAQGQTTQVQASLENVAAPLRQQIEALDRRVSELAALSPAQGSAQTAVDSAPKAAVDEARQQALQAQSAVQALVPRLDEIEAASRRAAGPSASSAGAARLVIAERLGRAIDDGRPFQQELAALGALGTPPDALAALTQAAAGGAPTMPALSEAFRKTRAAFVAEPAAPDAPLYERLLRLTDGLVRVRSTGAVEGTTPPALAARIEQALRRGDAAAAEAAFQLLPEPARRAGESFSGLLRQRAALDRAVKIISDDAVRALSSQN